MFPLFKRTQTVTLVVYCERCGKEVIKERYEANRTETVRVATICDACVKKEQDRDASGWD